jgi:hypothetical protein
MAKTIKTVSVGQSHLMRRCEEERVLLQLVTPGHDEADLGADVVAFLDRFGDAHAEPRTLSGELLLSLLAAGG